MKKWTVMVYMAGDNNLDEDGKEDLDEMCQVGSSSEFNVVVQFDREGKELQTKRYEIMPVKKGKAEARVVEMLGETNTGDPRVLEDFIRWGVEKYEAEHYLLVLWNHGRGFKDYDIVERSRIDGGYVKALREHRYYGGWLNKFLSVMRKALFIHPSLLKNLLPEKDELQRKKAPGRAVCIDEYDRDFIDCQELRKTLESAYKKTGRKIDIVGFDACLMNMMEVLCQAGDYAGYVVGSEETEPGEGWPYHLVLKVLREEPGISPEEFSEKIISAANDYYLGEGSIYCDSAYAEEVAASVDGFGDEEPDDWPVTLSAVKMGKLGALRDAVHEFAGALLRNMEHNGRIASEIMYCVQRFEDRDYADLGDFVSLCGSNIPQVKDESEKVRKALRDAVVAEIHLGESVENANGVSIFIPRSHASLKKNLESYRRLEFNKADKRWVALLEELRPGRKKTLERLRNERVTEERRKVRVM
jgi:hypothetical protein